MEVEIEDDNNSHISKLSIIKLARRAGIKTISKDSYDIVRTIIIKELNEIILKALILNSENNTKTLMVDDIYHSIKMKGINLTRV